MKADRNNKRMPPASVPLRDSNSSMPVALVGFREWVFSQDSGALASFAATTEFTFGSIMQRIMTWPGAVRFHYGHPDLWNKLFVMTRGGVSKATRGFHISEDVFAGYNHTLRGGKTKFKEYIAVGKGRDMGFDSINSFESKVGFGFGFLWVTMTEITNVFQIVMFIIFHLPLNRWREEMESK